MGFLHRPQLVSWRKAVFQIHLWTGVVLGLYVVAISVSGSALVFQNELMDHRPSVSTNSNNPQMDYTQLVTASQTAFPGQALDSIDMRTNDRRLATVLLRAADKHRTVYLNTATNQVVGSYIQEERHPVMLLLERFHNQLLGGRTAEVFNGVGGALLSLLCLTGIVVWWPGVKTWRRALGVKWSASWIRINFDLHGAVGFWTLLFIAMWGSTGAYFIFPEQVQKALGLFSNAAPPKISMWSPTQQLLPVGEYIAIARKLFPDSRLAFLYMDVFRPHGQVSVFLSRNPAVSLTLLEDIVRIDPATGEVLQVESSRKWSIAEAIAMATYAVHFGDFGGRTSKVIWVLAGLMPAVLAITGYLMWWNRSLSKKWRAFHAKSTKWGMQNAS